MRIFTFALVCSFYILSVVNCTDNAQFVDPGEVPVVFDRKNLGNFCLLPKIGGFLYNPYVNMPMLNTHCHHVFSKEVPLDVFITERFDMPEIFGIENCENELKHILSLSHLYEPAKFISTLAQDVFTTDIFDKIKEPLIHYLARRYEKCSEDERDDVDSGFNVIHHIIDHMRKSKNWEFFANSGPSILEEVSGCINHWETSDLIELFTLIRGNKNYWEKFLDNFSKLMYYYQTCLLPLLASIGAPEEIYLSKFLAHDIDSFKHTFSKIIEYSLHIPDHKAVSYERLERLWNFYKDKDHGRLSVEDYEKLRRVLNVLKLKNQVAFSEISSNPNFYRNFIKYASLKDIELVSLTLYAYSSGKMDLFDELLNDPRNRIKANLASMMTSPLYKDHMECLFFIYANVLTPEERAHRLVYFSDILLKYYELEDFENDDGNAKFSLKLLHEHGNNLNIPQRTEFTMNYVHVSDWSEILRKLKVSNAEVLYSLLVYLDLIRTVYYDNTSFYNNPSADVMNLCLKSKKLRTFLINSNTKFTINMECLLKLVKNPINSINFKSITNPLSDPLIKYSLRYATNATEMSRLERIIGHNVADIYLTYSNNDIWMDGEDSDDEDDTYSNYLKVRNLLKYWLSTEHKHRLNEIRLQFIKDNLKREFPGKTAGII